MIIGNPIKRFLPQASGPFSSLLMVVSIRGLLLVFLARFFSHWSAFGLRTMKQGRLLAVFRLPAGRLTTMDSLKARGAWANVEVKPNTGESS